MTELEHKFYIDKKGKYNPNLYGVIMSKIEIESLEKWYYWFDGLVNGDLLPINDLQREFVKMFESKLKNSSIPPNIDTKWFRELDEIVQIWVRYYYIKQKGDRIIVHIVNNPYSIFKGIVYSDENTIHLKFKNNIEYQNILEVENNNLNESNQKKSNRQKDILLEKSKVTNKEKKETKSNEISLTGLTVKCNICGNNFEYERLQLGFKNCKDCSGVQKKTIQEEGFHTRKGHQQIKNILYPRRRK